jgi:hypothetical protein
VADHLNDSPGVRPGVNLVGPYEGLAGIAFAPEETYKASGEDLYRRGFVDCLKRIENAAGRPDQKPTLIPAVALIPPAGTETSIASILILAVPEE